MIINSKSGVYSAIERMEKNELIKKTRIQKIPPEIIICLTKKGLDKLKNFSTIFPKFNSESNKQAKTQISIQSQEQIKSLKQSLEKSQSKIDSLTLSLEQSKNKFLSQSQDLEKSQDEVNSLTLSLEQNQSQKILPKKTNTEKKMAVLDDSEYKKRAMRIKEKIIDVLNIKEILPFNEGKSLELDVFIDICCQNICLLTVYNNLRDRIPFFTSRTFINRKNIYQKSFLNDNF